ncbi:MAG: hypothetical protein ACI8WT_001165 [Clostridium sp.]|jgi:hypothetical protein
MKKLLKTAFVLLLTFYILLLSSHNSYAFESINDEIVGSNKVWNINFNKELKFDDALQKSITVVDNAGTSVTTELKLGQDLKSIIIKPPVKGYNLGQQYSLKIDTDIYSVDNKKLQEPIQMNFKINNTTLVENTKNIKVIFNDNCNSLTSSGWVKDSHYTQNSFIADNSENEKYTTHIPYEQYLFYNNTKNSISKISKNIDIGGGPFSIEFDAKIIDLQTPTKNEGSSGFIIDTVASKKRYRLSFNSKDTDNKIKISLMNKATATTPFQTVDAYLPKDNNIHRWSIRNDGNKLISVLLDGNPIANFNNPDLASTSINDMVILSSDMTDALTGVNKIYIENFAIVKSLSIENCTVATDNDNQSVTASIAMAYDDENIITNKQYYIKSYLYKNDNLVAESTPVLVDNKNISTTINNITQSGKMNLVFKLVTGNVQIEETSKTVNINISTSNLDPGQTITSQPSSVYIYTQMDKMISQDQSDAEHSGWELDSYTDYENKKNGTIIENGENALALSMPVKLNGWFRVYVGYVTGTESFKIGKTDDPSPLQITSDISLKSNELFGDQWIYEKSTIISNFNNNSIKLFLNPSQRARIAYIKLIGLSQQQVFLYQKQQLNKKTVIYDFDGYTDFFLGKHPNVEALTSNTIGKLTGKNVAEVNWCLGTTGLLTYNSKYAGTVFDGVEAYDDQLRDGDALARYQIMNILNSGKSPLEIVADNGHENGIKVNASLRMDTFYDPDIYGFLNGAMYEDYNQFAQPGNFNLSYYYPQVRAYIRNILLEIDSFNNVGGITLDFCRYPTLFGTETSSEEKVLIMNEFLRTLRNELPKDKTITIRVPYNDPLQYGFDIKTWINEGLLNTLIPSSIGTEEFFNVKPYVDMVKDTNVRLYIGVSADVSGHDITKEEEALVKQGLYINNKVFLDIQQYLLRAYDVYEAGADGIFLFNSTSKLYIDNNAPLESTFLGDKVLIEKWHEFDYVSSFMVNKINVPKPSF